MFAYLKKEQEFDQSVLPNSDQIQIYPPNHALTRRFNSSEQKYFLAICPENLSLDSQFASQGWQDLGIFYEYDNPILHEPSTTARYLTHYILDKRTNGIVGRVEYSRKDGGYIGTLNDGKIIFTALGQTSYLTSQLIERYEEEDYFREVYLWPLQMMWVAWNDGRI